MKQFCVPHWVIIPATLIFHPLTYALLSVLDWRLTYAVFTGLIAAVGIPAAWTFHPHPKHTDYNPPTTEADSDLEDERPGGDVTIAIRSKIILGGIWLVSSTLKSIAYYTPFITLVGTNSWGY